MNIYIIIAIAAAAAAVGGMAVYIIARSGFDRRLTEARTDIDRLEDEIAGRDVRIQGLEKDVEYKQAGLEDLRRQHDEAVRSLKENYQKNLQETKEAGEKSLQQQIEAVKAQIMSESEKVLKTRQEEFSKKAEESLNTIAGDFNKNLSDMKEAFEANKKAQNDTSAELRTQIGEAVKNLKDQTASVGEKADHIASALRGQNKMQGCWGETQLHNLLINEGLVEGRDFDKEETLRDDLGIIIHNEDTGKRMRPDFILHYPDNTDIIVDCKVSLNALSDYFEAETDEARADAAERNLKAVRAQVENLSRKEYSSYLKSGRKCLDYTVMYVPNVNALVLARQKDPHVISDAFRKNVLITSEETLMPFLRLVRSAWINFEQARNQEKIIAAATRMIERVGLFCDSYAAVGSSLKKAVDAFESGDQKLRESGKSILHAAREVEALGVKSKKILPPLADEVLPETQTDE
ncbi:MAG: DNA recombination protein RmuC [Bacteroidales bacterium]|nr:DNA recombination protein RmuC [Bacteroidales bacterium]